MEEIRGLKQADGLPHDLVDLYFGLNPEGDKLSYLYTLLFVGTRIDETPYQ